MKELTSKTRKLISLFEKLDNRIQLGILSFVLLLLIILILKKRKNVDTSHGHQHNRSNRLQQQQDDRMKEKRDLFMWFFNFFLSCTVFMLIILASVYAAVKLDVKPVLKTLDNLKVDLGKAGNYLKITSIISSVVCIILYKLIFYYDKKIIKPLSDQQIQEQNDRLKEQYKTTEGFQQQTSNFTTSGGDDDSDDAFTPQSVFENSHFKQD